MDGYFSVNRKLLTSDKWLKETFTRGQAWIDLIGLATYEKSFIRVRGNKVPLERGQVGWSEIRLGERWHWSRGKVRRFLKELSEDEAITRKTVQQTEQHSKYVIGVLTIINYDTYQSGKQEVVQRTDSRQYSRRYPNNKGNKDNKDNKGGGHFFAPQKSPRRSHKKSAKRLAANAIKQLNNKKKGEKK